MSHIIAFRPKAETYFQIIVLQFAEALKDREVELSDVLKYAEVETKKKFSNFVLK